MGADVDIARKSKAQQRAARIRLHLSEAAHDYADAVVEEDWRVLGFDSVEAWAGEQFGQQRFTPAARKEVARLLAGAGQSRRQIAAATRVSKSAADRDLSGKTGNEVKVSRNGTVPIEPAGMQNAGDTLPDQAEDALEDTVTVPVPVASSCRHQYTITCRRCGEPHDYPGAVLDAADRCLAAEARVTKLEAGLAERDRRIGSWRRSRTASARFLPRFPSTKVSAATMTTAARLTTSATSWTS